MTAQLFETWPKPAVAPHSMPGGYADCGTSSVGSTNASTKRARSKAPIIVMIALVVFGICTPTSLLAQPESVPMDRTAQAEHYAAQAFAAYEQGEMTEAVALYMKALELAPSAKILYNIGKIYDLKIRDRELAMRFYRRYIADPGANPDHVRELHARLEELRALEVAADARPPASQPAHPPAPKPLQTEVRLDSVNQPALPAAESRRGRGLSSLQIAALVGGGIGVVGLGVGAVFGLSARSNQQDANCDGNMCASQADADRMKDAKRAAAWSTVSTVAGLSLIAVGVVFYFVGDKDSDEQPERLASLQLRTSVGPGFVGTHLTGQW